MSYLEHTKLVVPIELTRDCLGAECGPGTTCVAVCVSTRPPTPTTVSKAATVSPGTRRRRDQVERVERVAQVAQVAQVAREARGEAADSWDVRSSIIPRPSPFPRRARRHRHACRLPRCLHGVALRWPGARVSICMRSSSPARRRFFPSPQPRAMGWTSRTSRAATNEDGDLVLAAWGPGGTRDVTVWEYADTSTSSPELKTTTGAWASASPFGLGALGSYFLLIHANIGTLDLGYSTIAATGAVGAYPNPFPVAVAGRPGHLRRPTHRWRRAQRGGGRVDRRWCPLGRSRSVRGDECAGADGSGGEHRTLRTGLFTGVGRSSADLRERARSYRRCVLGGALPSSRDVYDGPGITTVGVAAIAGGGFVVGYVDAAGLHMGTVGSDGTNFREDSGAPMVEATDRWDVAAYGSQAGFAWIDDGELHVRLREVDP